MSERRITRRRGEGIRIDGPAVIRVNRRVTLTISAGRTDRVERLAGPASLPAPARLETPDRNPRKQAAEERAGLAKANPRHSPDEPHRNARPARD
jgi:hypothetical protein